MKNKIKIINVLILVAVLLIMEASGVIGQVQATTQDESKNGNKDGVSWIWDYKTGKLTISGNGNLGDVIYDIPSYNVNIITMEIGEGINYINTYYLNCKNLKNIEVSKNNPNYSSQNGILYNKDLTNLVFCPIGKEGKITLPSSVGRLNWYSDLSQCAKLTSIEVEEGNDFFYSKDGILYSKDKKTLYSCPSEKQGEVKILEEVENISSYAFYGCNKLTNIIMPNGLKEIGHYAFFACKELTNVVIPDGVEQIGLAAFYGCVRLKNIRLPNSITEIENSTFSGCINLTNIVIPGNVKNIGNVAFSRMWKS